jgi:hypothetical protein
MHTNILSTLDALQALASGTTEDFTPAVAVVADVGRLLYETDPDSMAEVGSALAAFRERLDFGSGVDRPPLRILEGGEKAEAYVAGAMWACSDIISAYVRRAEAVDERRRLREGRSLARKAALELGADRPLFRPADVLERLAEAGGPASADTVSKAIQDLLASGEVLVATPPEGADRRNRYYRLASGTDQADEVIEDADRLYRERQSEARAKHRLP